MGKPGQSRQAKFGEKGKRKKNNFEICPSDTFYPSQSAKICSEVPTIAPNVIQINSIPKYKIIPLFKLQKYLKSLFSKC
jgi:hypothetical protein